MKNVSTLAHIGIAFATILLLSVLFTFAPYRLPTPETLSPWVYLTAAVLCLIGLILLRKSGRALFLYIPLFLLSIFGFLEETSYGVESGTFQPIYSQDYHVEIYDVHNLLPVIEQILSQDMQKAGWNFSMTVQFLRADGIIIMGLMLFCVAAQWFSRREKPADIPRRVFQLASLAVIAFTLIAVIWLISLPADLKNKFLFGFSLTRLATIVGLLILGVVVPVFGLLSRARTNNAIQKINYLLSSRKVRVTGTTILGFALIVAIAYQLWAPSTIYTGQIAVLERVNPLILWVTAILMLFLIALASRKGALQSFFARLGNGLKTFFSNNPAYIYAVFCILIVGFAQLMDQNFVSLTQYIRFPNPWGEEWNYWIEETFEMTGAFELIVATLFLLFGKAIIRLPALAKQKRN